MKDKVSTAIEDRLNFFNPPRSSNQNYWSYSDSQLQGNPGDLHFQPFVSSTYSKTHQNQGFNHTCRQNKSDLDSYQPGNFEQQNHLSQQHFNSLNTGYSKAPHTNDNINSSIKLMEDEVHKEQGNTLFRQKQYAAAIEKYQAAIVS